MTRLFVRVWVAAKVTTVSVVAGNVITVAPVVRRLRALVAEKVMTSPPPMVIALVARVVESETVRVLPDAPKAIVPSLVVTVRPVVRTSALASVPEKVRVLLKVAVLPLVIVSVPVLEVMVNPLIDVAVATPRTGVTSVGVFAKTREPLPVSSEMTPASSAEVVAAKTLSLFDVYVTVPPVPKATEDASVPVKVKVLLTLRVLAFVMVKTPVELVIVRPLMLVAVATPKTGVTRVGVLAKTNDPEPVSSEMTPANWAEVVAAKTASVFAVVVSVPEVGRVSAVEAVAVKVMSKAPEVAKTLPLAKVNVAPVAG